MDANIIEGRYQLIEPIGEGGLGTVYYGWDQQLERAVAIKRLRSSDGYREPESEAYQEARIMAALQHPNIVTLYDFGIDDQGPYFIMEYLQGHTLAEQIKAAVLNSDQFRSLAQQCLEGLMAAHDAGVVHRDMKPNNIMLLEARNAPFRVKILDFGMASMQQAPRKQTVSDDGSMMGSIYYMAPEQLSRNPVDARTDLYALGHVIYHALAGKTAFEGSVIMDLINAHLHDVPAPIRSYRSDLDEAIEAWLQNLMQRDPALRPSSAQAALISLPGGVDSGPIELVTAATPTAASRPHVSLRELSPPDPRSGRGWLWWMAGGVAAIAVAGLAFVLSGDPATEGRETDPLVQINTGETGTAESQPVAIGQGPGPDPIPEATTTRYQVDDLLKLGAKVGEVVTIQGTPVEVGQNQSRTIYYLNFSENYREAISLVFFISNQPESFTRERLEKYVGKQIRVRGKVERYQNALQMKIRSLDQIETLN
jgi:serine/threonine protein kinase